MLKEIAGRGLGFVDDGTVTRPLVAAAAGKAKMQKTAKDFESMFLEQSLDVLNRSQGTDGPLGENGTGGGVYRSMLNKEYAQSIVQSGGVGIGDQVMREMIRLQGGAHG